MKFSGKGRRKKKQTLDNAVRVWIMVYCNISFSMYMKSNTRFSKEIKSSLD